MSTPLFNCISGHLLIRHMLNLVKFYSYVVVESCCFTIDCGCTQTL